MTVRQMFSLHFLLINSEKIYFNYIKLLCINVLCDNFTFSSSFSDFETRQILCELDIPNLWIQLSNDILWFSEPILYLLGVFFLAWEPDSSYRVTHHPVPLQFVDQRSQAAAGWFAFSIHHLKQAAGHPTFHHCGQRKTSWNTKQTYSFYMLRFMWKIMQHTSYSALYSLTLNSIVYHDLLLFDKHTSVMCYCVQLCIML